MPQALEALVHLGSRESEDEQRAMAQVTQGRVDQLHGRQVAPVQILEHQQQRTVATYGMHQVLPRASDLIGHQRRVLPRGA